MTSSDTDFSAADGRRGTWTQAQERVRHIAEGFDRPSGGPSWLGRAEAWLDARGKGAWIAAMVVGFVAFWPIGLALLAYMIWSKRMFTSSSGPRGRFCGGGRRSASWEQARSFRDAMRPSGNGAFDSYKADMLKRLEQEQRDFEAFLERLREAKDKAEFDQFMDERERRAREAETQGAEDEAGALARRD
ncbi:DUF2852 domain-containing protein [Pseudoroseicyclus aestuarii]|uniref:Uncharacterized protein DUF2852 n=1 Tax=Pseudoroseicyclus aestuarii TaxID=1795041 RepID=A0A318SVX1_9RHOB|nr:DUF2852 domain-containing protein [Pseudoroseicyclus aestuarii]PYE85642.1 uncharacterized protein DUF2852 [Pseudoroseicyclus aestuarii]